MFRGANVSTSSGVGVKGDTAQGSRVPWCGFVFAEPGEAEQGLHLGTHGNHVKNSDIVLNGAMEVIAEL